MPRYFFHVFNDEVTIDDEGLELANQETALLRARSAVTALAAESVKDRRHLVLHHRVDVADEHQRLVASLRFSDVIRVEL